ncbi:MAG: transcription termination/antitermination protein NusA [Endomicrobiales bacterium]|nr:transcription termination/antitermination protein NusA [Endomicrobiales bacterium]
MNGERKMSEKSELILALEQIEKDKGIKREDILHVIENALVSAYKKHVGKNVNVEAQVDPETGSMKAVVVKKVVDEIANPGLEIKLDEAKRADSQIKTGDDLKIPLDTQDFARIAAQTAKQVIMQKIKESERESLFDEYQKKIGVMVSGVVWRFANRNLIVDIGKTEAILPISEQIFRERFNLGQHIRAVIVRVEKSPRGPAIILSRSHPDVVKRLFEVEVPEIYEKIVEIVNVVREAGMRTKVAVISRNPKVDPVGACVGVKGARVKPIIEELQGERIDLIPFTNDPAKYIASALSPAKVIAVSLLSENEKKAEVLVGDDMLSLAIGKNGHNVRLAARLTGWHIDVKSEAQKKKEASEKSALTVQSLEKLEGIGPKTADVLLKAGIRDIAKLAGMNVDDLTAFQGIGPKTAEKIIDSAAKHIRERSKEAEEPAKEAAETETVGKKEEKAEAKPKNEEKPKGKKKETKKEKNADKEE